MSPVPKHKFAPRIPPVATHASIRANIDQCYVAPRFFHANVQFSYIEKSFFVKITIEYLGFWVTREGIKPIDKKVEAIKNMMPPTS